MIRLLIFLLLATPILTACGSSNSDDSTQQQVHEDNERRKAAYNRIKGVYEGTLVPRTSPNNPISVQLVLYTYDLIEQNPDPNGDPVIRTTLLGQFRAPGTISVIDDINLATAYDINTGHITLNNANFNRKTCPVGPAYSISIDGNFVNGNFEGSIRREAVTWGTLSLKPSGLTVAEPISDQIERLVRSLSPLIGEYGGDFAATDGSNEKFKVKIQLRVENVQTDFGDGFIFCPALRGTYTRPDLGPNIGILSLSGVYFPALDFLNLESIVDGPISSPRIFPPSQGYKNLKIEADINKSVLSDGSYKINSFSGEMKWWKYTGVLDMKKTL